MPAVLPPEKISDPFRRIETDRDTMSLRYTPHPGQRRIHACPARFRTLAMGRRWGKTLFGNAEVAMAAIRFPGVYYWVAPTFDLCQISWELWPAMVDQRLWSESVQQRYRELINGSRIYWRSADNPRSLVGRGLRGLVVDEAGDVDVSAWEESLRPAIAEWRGWAVFIGTPRGRNWFWERWMTGNRGDDSDWASFQCPSEENPYFPRDEVARARREMPERFFRQEFLAEFLEDGEGVFLGVDGIVSGDYGRVRPETYVLGIDLAKHTDWTVCYAIGQDSKRLVACERFHRINWDLQKERIRDFMKAYPGPAYVDSTGLGDPIVDDLLVAGADIIPFTLSQASKGRIIQQLAIAIEQRLVSIPDDPVLTGELKSYTYRKTPNGQYTYAAPPGGHDDCVIALALAWEGCRVPQELVYIV